MTIRIVIMYFDKAEANRFLVLFERHKVAILNSQGCSYLRLLKDSTTPCCYITWSHWDDLENLNIYRKSQLFEGIWSHVKPLFLRPPQVFSFKTID